MTTISRDLLQHLNHHVLRPITNRVANSMARCVVSLVNDQKKLQLLQIGVLDGETVDHAEHFQPYGITSVPLGKSADGQAEGVVLFPNGDRGHPLVVAISDRRYRPTSGEPGQVTIYNHAGAKVIMKASGDVEIEPAPGHAVMIREPGGAAAKLPTLADFEALRSAFNSHTHVYSAGPAEGAITAAPASTVATVPVAAPTGTSVLKAQ